MALSYPLKFPRRSWVRRHWAFFVSLFFCGMMGLALGAADISIFHMALIFAGASGWSLFATIEERNNPRGS